MLSCTSEGWQPMALFSPGDSRHNSSHFILSLQSHSSLILQLLRPFCKALDFPLASAQRSPWQWMRYRLSACLICQSMFPFSRECLQILNVFVGLLVTLKQHCWTTVLIVLAHLFTENMASTNVTKNHNQIRDNRALSFPTSGSTESAQPVSKTCC